MRVCPVLLSCVLVCSRGVVCTLPGQSPAILSTCLSLSSLLQELATLAPGQEKLVSCHLEFLVLVLVVVATLSLPELSF